MCHCNSRGYLRLFTPHDGSVYEARQGGDLVDTGNELVGFVQDLLCQQTLNLADAEIAVWRLTPGRGPRLVAVLYPDGKGYPAVRWL
jgi:hypothetical protein